MIARTARLSAALLALAPLAAAVHAQGLEYAAGTTKYRVTTNTKGSQTSPMGNMDFEVALQEKLTLDVMKHAKDTVMATLTVDSISLKTAGPVPDVSKLTGARFVSLVSPTGKFYSSKSPDGLDPQLAQISEGIARFLPAYRANLAQGMTWTDTTSGKVNQQGMDVERTSISSYKVDGDTTIAGEKAWRVQRNTTVKAAGSGTMQGTPVAMESLATSTGAYFLSPKGIYLGSNSKDVVDLKISILAQNAEIAIKQNAQTNVEAIR